MRVGAVLEQEDAVLAAVGGDPLALEGEVAADVDEHRRARAVTLRLGLEVLEGEAQVVAAAVDEHGAAARGQDGQRRGHEGVRGAQDVRALDARVRQGRLRGAGPAREGDGGRPVPGGPGRLEAVGHRALRPLLGVEDLVPERVEPAAVARVEADGEAFEGRHRADPGSRGGPTSAPPGPGGRRVQGAFRSRAAAAGVAGPPRPGRPAVVADWDDVRRLALALPETSERLSRGLRQWRVKDKLVVWERPLRRSDLDALGDAAPDGPILGARVEHLGAKEALLADDPGVFFTTPHFDGYPAVLVRLDRIAVGDLDEVVVEAWLARAPARLVKAFLDARA